MKRSILIAAATALTTGLLYAASSLASPAPVVALRTATVDTAELDRLIDVFEDHADGEPTGDFFGAKLGELYLTRAQETNSLDDYGLALEQLSPLEDGTDPSVSIPLARTQLALHDFAGALETVTSLQDGATSPTTSNSTTFDAHIGLGRFDDAAASLETLLRLHPNEPAILIRQAELAFLTGDTPAALSSSRQALSLAEGAELSSADMVFYLTARARYLINVGEYEMVADLTSQSLELDASNPATLLLSAKAAAALGDLSKATITAQTAAEIAPEPATLAFLADLRLATGDAEGAAAELDTIEAIASLGDPASRRSVALSLAEAGRALDFTLEAAQQELTERSDPYSHHLMATVLLASGSGGEAEPHFGVASSVDDPMIWYRGGLIAEANGDSALAMERFEFALELSPQFHPIYADDAAARLERLGS